MTSKKPRTFIRNSRCIYTGDDLQAGDSELAPSHEHIIPLALGGSNQFTTDDVAVKANNRAGQEIDDAVASMLPFMTLRHKYKLQGNRKVIPNISLWGKFLDIQAKACMDIDANGDITFQFEDEQKTTGQIIALASTEERVRFFLTGRLAQADKRGLALVTPFGQITDTEDIEIALMLADRNEGKQFNGMITINVREYHCAVGRLMIKIALGLGHRVFGSEWTFSPGGHKLRTDLFRRSEAKTPMTCHGTLHADLPHEFRHLIGITPDHHVMMVAPSGKTTVAIIALFGGEAGIAVIDLGYDSRSFFKRAAKESKRVECAFAIPLNAIGSRPFIGRTMEEIANNGAINGLLPATRAEAQFRATKSRR
jgi:hypothetical protein